MDTTEAFVVVEAGGARTTYKADGSSAVEQLPLIEPTAAEVAAQLAAAKIAMKAAIEAARDAAIFGGVETPAGRVDTDERSVTIINGYAVSALIAQAAGAPFAASFRMADNSEVAIDGPAMLAVKLALDRLVAGAYAWSWAAKAAVDAAATIEGVAAVDLTVPDEAAA